MRGWERFKGGSRLEFVCGTRALATLRELREATSATTRLLSVLPNELAAAVEKLQRDDRELRREMRALTTALAGHEATALATRAESIGGVATVVHAAAGRDAAALKVLASSLVAEPGRLAVIFSTENPVQAIVARSADVTLDAARLLRTLTMRFGGKGGGRADLAQGGGLIGTAEEIAAFTREAIREITSQ